VYIEASLVAAERNVAFSIDMHPDSVACVVRDAREMLATLEAQRAKDRNLIITTAATIAAGVSREYDFSDESAPYDVAHLSVAIATAIIARVDAQKA
jgi:hypothetical protein